MPSLVKDRQNEIQLFECPLLVLQILVFELLDLPCVKNEIVAAVVPICGVLVPGAFFRRGGLGFSREHALVLS